MDVCKYAFMHACKYARKYEWMDGDGCTYITNHEYEQRHTAKNYPQPRADGPDRLVSNHNVFHLLFGHTLETLGQLDRADLCVEVGFVLLLRLANAQDRLNPAFQSTKQIIVDSLIRRVEHHTALAVSNLSMAHVSTKMQHTNMEE